jgi:predicted nucleic acid-binding protein
MTAKVFADTNIAIYAEGSDARKAQRATAILESTPVVSTQVVNETISALTRKYGFTLTEAHEVASGLLDLCEVVPVTVEFSTLRIGGSSRRPSPRRRRVGREGNFGH